MRIVMLSQVKEESKRQVSVARLFPEKNRSIDCVPYDHARVTLPTATDNYINAAFVKVSSCHYKQLLVVQQSHLCSFSYSYEIVMRKGAVQFHHLIIINYLCLSYLLVHIHSIWLSPLHCFVCQQISFLVIAHGAVLSRTLLAVS